MKSVKVRTIHRRLGISIAFFLFVQAIAGMLMSIGKLASVDTSPLYNILYSVHADWDPWGSIYRVVLGLATAMQAVLGIIIFRGQFRSKRKKDTPLLSPDQPLEKEVSITTLSFAAHIRPLFRPFDVESMKPAGLDLSSYEEVKRHAQAIYARISAKQMPCDGSWSDSQIQKFKEWMEGAMEP